MQNLSSISTEVLWLIVSAMLIAALLSGFAVLLLGRRSKNMTAFGDILLRGQAELAGRLAQLGEHSQLEQGKIARAIEEQKLAVLKLMDEKLLAVTKSVGEGLQQNTAKTAETLTDLRERLAKIDVAQQKISSLSEQVVSLQEVLSNKQARGAFGEIQLNDLVTSILPPSVYEFQAVLSNGKRADCLLHLPNPPGSIVIDAKFPLESYSALRSASGEREKADAERSFRFSVLKHIKDISEKYILAGETAESALMFLPSEAVYAELHAHFTDVVEASYRAKVWIVSPTTLMATLNTVRAVLKDAQMREQAGVIQKEVGTLTEDISRLDARIDSLSKHFKLAGEDVDNIKISSAKIGRRIQKIEDLELGENTPRLAVGRVSNDD